MGGSTIGGVDHATGNMIKYSNKNPEAGMYDVIGHGSPMTSRVGRLQRSLIASGRPPVDKTSVCFRIRPAVPRARSPKISPTLLAYA